MSDYVAQRLAELGLEPRQPRRRKRRQRRAESRELKATGPTVVLQPLDFKKMFRKRTTFFDWALKLGIQHKLCTEVLLSEYRRSLRAFKVLPMDQLRALPVPHPHLSYPGVYFLWHGPALVYIGKSRNVTGRIFQHMKTREFSRYTFYSAPEDLARAYERIYIATYRPCDNKRP